MNVKDYVEQKEVKGTELIDNFKKTKEYKGHLRGKKCGNCDDELNVMNLPSEPWTKTLYCWKCHSLTHVLECDPMGGAYENDIKIYRNK